MLERGKMDRDLVEFVVIDQLVPKEHLLRKVDAAVDFTQLYEMVEPLYCEDNGRPSIDPVVLFKMVLILCATIIVVVSSVFSLNALRSLLSVLKSRAEKPVSYTHLTLPTTSRV